MIVVRAVCVRTTYIHTPPVECVLVQVMIGITLYTTVSCDGVCTAVNGIVPLADSCRPMALSR